MKNANLLFSIFALFVSLEFTGQQSVFEIQFTEDPQGDSPYIGEIVTITGIVTASAKEYDLGFVYIQDEGGGPWSGIWLNGGGVQDLYRNEEITVSGTVIEHQGFTAINVSSYELTGLLKEIKVSEIDPSDSAAYQNNGMEKWESVLVMYKAANGSKLFISHPKTSQQNDYGDYAVSPKSKTLAKKLGLILAGRVTSSLFSSLYVQIVSDLAWENNSGQMQVNPIETSTDMEMDGVIGQLTYGFGNYRLLPRNNDDFVNINVELDPTYLPGSPLSIEEFQKKKMKVFPNPSSGFVSINTDSKIKEISIFSLSGSIVSHHTIFDDNPKVDVSILQPGIYFLQVKTHKNELISTKIVVQR